MLQMVPYQTFKSTRNRNPQRIKKSDEKMIEQLNYEGIEFPVAVKQYNKIEKQNKYQY